MISRLVSSLLLAATSASGADDPVSSAMPAPLDQQLRREDPAALARDARRLGDARRGALVFYQPALTCTRCHVNEKADATAPTLGPDLAAIGKDAPDVELVESILEPSKVIKKGYEPVTIATDDGRTITGLLAEERPDAVVLRDPAQDGKPVAIARDRIEQRRKGGPSLMPAGLVNALASRQQFLDLVRYLMEIAEYGPARARALRPDPALVVAAAARVRAPARPRRADRRPGTGRASAAARRSTPASAPTATAPRTSPARCPPRRASPRPRSRTAATPTASIARSPTASARWRRRPGWCPRQKYDVIHYIREAYLKPHNPAQYAAIDRAYLDRLPEGDDAAAPRRRRSSPGSRWITARA